MDTKPIKAPANWKELSYHPLAQLTEFGKGIDIAQLAKHLKKYGYDEKEPIVLFEDFVLDGRHRMAACKIAGIIPTFAEYTGKEAFAYVAKKIFRQHLSVGERAKLAATYANLDNGERLKRPPSSNELGSNLSEGIEPTPNITVRQAAKLFGVSEASVKRAKAAIDPLCKHCKNMVRKSLPVREKCPECKDMKDRKEAKRNSKKKRKSKNGTIVFTKYAFTELAGKWSAGINKMAHAAKLERATGQVIETPEMKSIRADIEALLQKTKDWCETLNRLLPAT